MTPMNIQCLRLIILTYLQKSNLKHSKNLEKKLSFQEIKEIKMRENNILKL